MVSRLKVSQEAKVSLG